jgi:outer membrane protein TolC
LFTSQINTELSGIFGLKHVVINSRMKFFWGFVISFLTVSAALAQTYKVDHYLDIAKTSSPLLKDLKNQVLLSQLDSLRLRAGLKAQVTGNGGALFAPVIDGFGYAGSVTNFQTLSALISVNKTLISKQYLNSQLSAISLQKDSITTIAKISELDLKKAITGQYITAYGSLQQVKFSEEVIVLLTKEQELLKSLTRSNVYRQSDYLSFLVTLKQQQLQLLQAKLQYRNDYTMLNYLSGIVDTAYVILEKPDLENTHMPQPGNSIFFKKFQLDSVRLINGRKLIDFSYKPKANIFADGGYNTDFYSQPYKNFGTSFGFNISVPIYDGGVRKLQYKRIALQEETRLNYKAFYNAQYRQQIAQLNQQISETDSLLVQIDDQLKYSETLIKVDTELLQTGDLKIADLILAVNNYLTVKNLKTTTAINKLQLINQLNYWNR